MTAGAFAHKTARATLICAGLLLPATVRAQPVPATVSGTLTQGQTVTIGGTLFGTKSPAAPRIWDQAEGSNVLTLWDEAKPTAAGSTCTGGINCNMAYRTPIQGVALPHSAAGNTKYLAGAHRLLDTSDGGNQVWVIDDRGSMTFPYFVRWMYYWRADPLWANPNGDPDDNWKIHTVGLDPLSNSYWYYEYASRPATSATTNISQDASDSGGLGYRCRSTVVGACHSSNPSVGFSVGDSGSPKEPNPINGWIHVEFIEKFTRLTDGFVIRWENGNKVFHSIGETDLDTGTTTRKETLGSYARSRGPNNFRYFDDIYYDWGQDAMANVMMCMGATFTTRGLCEPQIPSAWSNTSITATWNTGGIASGARFLYVCDRNNVCNTVGLAITNGGSSGGTMTAPANLRIGPGLLLFAGLIPFARLARRKRRN